MSPSHPLRRISTGSLSGLARSTDRSTKSAAELDFLAPALTELADEAATLAANMQRVGQLHDALGTFNEGFSAYLYAMKMNAFCIEWDEAPDPSSWARKEELERLEARTAVASGSGNVLASSSSSATRASNAPPTPGREPSSPGGYAGDMTYATVYDDEQSRRTTTAAKARPGAAAGPSGAGAGGRPSALKKPTATTAAAKKAALAAKKKRDIEVSRIIDTQLPLEYRGGDMDARLGMEKVIGRLMDSEEGLAIAEIVAPPELPHPRVNKALIALVAKKLVAKNMTKGKTIYGWVGQ
ncbi:uncharacterized protein EHS24_000588 [Apiotrichum porosum]|uniref:DASH complex subunit DAM1 n=1 Tax=Apiotrichum porosum TaxID=105984 RepID=A0A427YA76_9TREE|nr:uncharacterized protein EHS24_000588 [Apiotrichum porosum]RSH88061.1 hypothetical protein EHS24_000588 [Apiotrichum porosum]